MTTIDVTTRTARRRRRPAPAPTRPRCGPTTRASSGWPPSIGAVAAEHAADHDRDATFVAEAYDAMREHRLPGAGRARGAGRAGRHPAPDLLRPGRAGPARRRHRAGRDDAPVPDADAGVPLPGRAPPTPRRVLRRVVDEGIVIATSGGSDWLWPTTIAVVDGRRAAGDGPQGVLQPVPRRHGGGDVGGHRRAGRRGRGRCTSPCRWRAEGVSIVETWDTLGMRGTASHDLVLEDVVVPARQDRRPPAVRRAGCPADAGGPPLRARSAAPATSASPAGRGTWPSTAATAGARGPSAAGVPPPGPPPGRA